MSACLLGERCKYSGGHNFSEAVAAFVRGHEVIPVCPEQLGGLPTPRVPAEIVGGTVMNRDGENVDAAFRLGAERAFHRADLAVLQPRSPSCGVGWIYDGTFTGALTPGDGVFAALLRERGVPAVPAAELPPGGPAFLNTTGK